jgi:transposase-like protein
MRANEPKPGLVSTDAQPPAGSPGRDQAQEDPEVRYTVAAVARRLGVAPATLRTWDRRYGMGPSERELGTRRRYSAADVDRLQVMRRLVVEGSAPADAARVAAAGHLDPTARTAGRGPSSGGRVLAVPDGSHAARGLGRAAMALDVPTLQTTLRRALAEHGVDATWNGLLRPVLNAVGRRWAATGEGVDVEHVLTECAIGAFRQVGDRLTDPRHARPVLLACVEREQHSLPLYALAAALAEHGLAARVLGAGVPHSALEAAVGRTGAGVLFLWAELAAAGSVASLPAVPRTRPPIHLVVGGAGWEGVVLPTGVERARTLRAAVDLVGRLLSL